MPSRILRLWNPTTSAWEEVGDSRLTAHVAAADPHPGYLLETLVDAKGDLVAASADNTPARLAVGTNGQVLTADSAQPLGVRWGTPASGGLDQATADTLYVNVAGPDAMTGALAIGPAGLGTDAHLYGAATGAITWATTVASGNEVGVRFRATAGGPLGAVRWYRVTAGQTAPATVRLWDTTATGAPVWTSTPAELAPFADTAVGWKPATLATGTRPALVAGRDYVVSVSTTASAATYYALPPNPTPESPLVFVNHTRNTGGAGAYPGTVDASFGYGLDPVLLAGTGGPTAASGELRLPNTGAVAWRNAGNTADLTLSVDASNALTFAGAALQTQTTADARYLQLTGGTLTGDLVLSEATPTVSLQQAGDTQPRARLSDTALAFGPGGSTATDLSLTRQSSTEWRVAGGLVPTANVARDLGSSALRWRKLWGQDADLSGALVVGSPAGTGPLTASVGGTTKLALGATGTLTLTPDASTTALSLGGYLMGTGEQIVLWTLPSGGGPLRPLGDGSMNLGTPSFRYGTLYAVAGTINTSSREAKQDITPLDPAEAMAAVRATTPVTFDYKAPERTAAWYELPDDPEQAEQVLLERLTAAPLEAGARHQAGFVLGDQTGQYPTDPLFETGEGQSNAANSVGVLLAALRDLDARVQTLEGA